MSNAGKKFHPQALSADEVEQLMGASSGYRFPLPGTVYR